MTQVRQIHSIVQGVTNDLQSSDNSPIQTTHSSTGDRFTQEQKRKTVLFFNRLQLIYGRLISWPLNIKCLSSCRISGDHRWLRCALWSTAVFFGP